MIKERSIFWVCIKKPGHQNERPDTWTRLIKGNNDNAEVVATGDFNVHNIVWNCVDTDINGERLAEEMEEENMFVINTMSRIGESDTNDSNIDLLFVSRGIADKFECEQSIDSWGSDHFPITFNFNERIDTYIKKNNRISTKRTNWKKYSSILRAKSEDFTKEDQKKKSVENRIYNQIKDLMIEAVNSASGRKNIKIYVYQSKKVGRK